MPDFGDYHHFKRVIQALPLKQSYERDDLLTDGLLMDREGGLSMYYAPHNEVVQPSARVVIVGITPGWQQMELAYRTFKQAIQQGLPEEDAFRHAKSSARFAGAMRRNLLQMLGDLGLHAELGLPDIDSLFDDNCRLLHTTSALRYPVFSAGKNYTGHQPPLMASAFLRTYALQLLNRDIGQQTLRPLFIPLGRTVEEVFRAIVQAGTLEASQCLWGFPHPSGANGHRHTQFQQNRNEMKRSVAEYFRRA
ncbi:hypothetical protein [Paenibacillus nasutitermitis]|uniref:Uracil DNA glycosylase superfamily protein n=1 Tax=Paenibacillus nasutitermitis TaxID=1652958 RepID=A0A917DN43_9BACL|nr:hypothetical protein [Paenibacillus nasutitermitis]GGD49881.1 hypothetical protein GCM10010911_04280 [Paenibacillus nasutitermitis]